MSNANNKPSKYRLLYANVDAPTDYRRMAYFICFYLGVGNLFPWNAFITASNYYAERFAGTSFEDSFENYFSISFNIFQTLGLALSLRYGSDIRLQNKIIWPFFCYSLIFVLNTVLVVIVDINPNVLFGITLLSSALAGCCGSVLSGGLFGLTAMLPSLYTGSLMNGQALAGLAVSLASILTSLSEPPIDTCSDDSKDDSKETTQSISYSALSYFIIATLVLLTCIFTFLVLSRLEFTKHYLSKAEEERTEMSNQIVNPFITDEACDATLHPSIQPNQQQQPQRYSRLSRDSGDRVDRMVLSSIDGWDIAGAGDQISAVSGFRPSLMTGKIFEIFDIIRIPALAVFINFTVTLSLFPALTVLLESSQKCKSSERFYNDLYVPIFFLMYNFFDFVGRIVAGLTAPSGLFTAENIWMGAASRAVFYPLFLLCNLSNSRLPVLFKDDAFPFIFMILFALSSGYVGNHCMMFGASRPTVAPKDASLAGSIMVFSLIGGLLIGSCLSFPVVYISQGAL